MYLTIPFRLRTWLVILPMIPGLIIGMMLGYGFYNGSVTTACQQMQQPIYLPVQPRLPPR